jgi:FKBP-type peptidyl-prolyl cis-trans isomerase
MKALMVLVPIILIIVVLVIVSKNATIGKPMDNIATVGKKVTVNYTGRLTDGTVFDSNVDPKFNHVQPFTFNLGSGEVIKGWDEGVVGMKVGEKKTLTISPDKGYGSAGAPPAIPANATLIFDVELLKVE